MRTRRPRNCVTSHANIDFTMATNDRGYEQVCVFAACLVSGSRVGPVWGDSRASVLRALATLTEECRCGAQFHKCQDGDE
jgi:hypothetical protein